MKAEKGFRTSDIQASEFRIQNSGFRLQTSDFFRIETSDLRLKTSLDFRLWTSDPGYQSSNFSFFVVVYQHG